MSGVNGNLSYAELQRIRNDNVDYESDRSLAKVNLYIQATDAMLTTPLRETEHAGERVSIDPAILERQLERARRWKTAQSVTVAPLPVFQPAPCWRDE